MDLNSARVLFMAWIIVSFALVLYVVFSKRNKDNYRDAARSIVDDSDTPPDEPAESNRNHGAQ